MNKNVKYLWCVIDVFTKYAWIKPLKEKTVLNAFIQITNESYCKPNILWVEGREFFNILVQEWQENNDILMDSTHYEGTSVIAEKFTNTLKAKIYKKNES